MTQRRDEPWPIERALELAGMPSASPTLRRRVLDAAPGRGWRARWRPVAAFVAASALGFVFGWSFGPPLDIGDDLWASTDAEVFLLGPDDPLAGNGDVG